MVPFLVQGGVDVEVLQLRKGEEGRCGNYMNAKGFCKAVVVDVEWILECEKAVTVRMHGACIFDDVYVVRRPTSCDVGNDNLL